MMSSPPAIGVKRIDVAAGVSQEALVSSIVCRAETLDELQNLRPEHFPDPVFAFLYATARKLWEAGIRPDIAAIASDIAATGDLEEALGEDWLGRLMNLGEYGASITPEYHASKLIEAYDRRRIALQLETIQGRLTDPSEPLDSILKTFNDLSEFSTARDIKPLSVGQLIAEHKTLRQPVVDGLIRRGEVCNIIAKSKVGKSWLGYSLLFAVALGQKWLGRFQCTTGRALLVDNELHPSDLAFRLKTVGDALGFAPDDYQNRIDVIHLRGRLTDIYCLREHLQRARDQYSLIHLDALYRFQPKGGDENSNSQMAGIYNELDKYAELTGAAITCIGHASKGDQSGKDVTDVGAGAGAQSRAADCHLILRPHQEDGAAVMDAAIRSFAPIEPFVLRWAFPLWEPDSQLDPAHLKMPKTRQDERQTAKNAEGFDAIVKALREHGELTRSRVLESANLTRERGNRLLATMVQDGRLNATETTFKGNRTTSFSLANYIKSG